MPADLLTSATTLAASSSPKALWYLTRGAGVVTLLLLTVSVLFGVATSVGWSWSRLPRFVVVALHRNVSLLVVVFVGIHVATMVLDGYVPIRWIDAVVPFIGAYHPLEMGLGALAFDLLLAVLITSALRARMTFESWRLVHWLAYVCWPIALLHGFLIGTDRREPWMLAIDAACVALVGIAVTWRVLRGTPSDGTTAVAAPGVATGARRLTGSRS